MEVCFQSSFERCEKRGGSVEVLELTTCEVAASQVGKLRTVVSEVLLSNR